MVLLGAGIKLQGSGDTELVSTNAKLLFLSTRGKEGKKRSDPGMGFCTGKGGSVRNGADTLLSLGDAGCSRTGELLPNSNSDKLASCIKGSDSSAMERKTERVDGSKS
jgi:hypothetical protein